MGIAEIRAYHSGLNQTVKITGGKVTAFDRTSGLPQMQYFWYHPRGHVTPTLEGCNLVATTWTDLGKSTRVFQSNQLNPTIDIRNLPVGDFYEITMSPTPLPKLHTFTVPNCRVTDSIREMRAICQVDPTSITRTPAGPDHTQIDLTINIPRVSAIYVPPSGDRTRAEQIDVEHNYMPGVHITEDMDSTYSQMNAGWRVEAFPTLVGTGESPTSLAMLLAQHWRWAKGGEECFLEYLKSLAGRQGQYNDLCYNALWAANRTLEKPINWLDSKAQSQGISSRIAGAISEVLTIEQEHFQSIIKTERSRNYLGFGLGRIWQPLSFIDSVSDIAGDLALAAYKRPSVVFSTEFWHMANAFLWYPHGFFDSVLYGLPIAFWVGCTPLYDKFIEFLSNSARFAAPDMLSNGSFDGMGFVPLATGLVYLAAYSGYLFNTIVTYFHTMKPMGNNVNDVWNKEAMVRVASPVYTNATWSAIRREPAAFNVTESGTGREMIPYGTLKGIMWRYLLSAGTSAWGAMFIAANALTVGTYATFLRYSGWAANTGFPFLNYALLRRGVKRGYGFWERPNEFEDSAATLISSNRIKRSGNVTGTTILNPNVRVGGQDCRSVQINFTCPSNQYDAVRNDISFMVKTMRSAGGRVNSFSRPVPVAGTDDVSSTIIATIPNRESVWVDGMVYFRHDFAQGFIKAQQAAAANLVKNFMSIPGSVGRQFSSWWTDGGRIVNRFINPNNSINP